MLQAQLAQIITSAQEKL